MDTLPGDLVLVLRAKPHPPFRRSGEGGSWGRLSAAQQAGRCEGLVPRDVVSTNTAHASPAPCCPPCCCRRPQRPGDVWRLTGQGGGAVCSERDNS